MRQDLHFVTLGVSDLPTSRRFYVEGLGWEPTLDIAEIVFLQVAPGVLLGLFAASDLAHDIGDPPPSVVPGLAPGRMALAQNVGSEAEVDAAVARAVAAGGTVVKPPQQAAFGGYHGYVADPDGFRWEIAHNPGWSIDPDGKVRFGPMSGA